MKTLRDRIFKENPSGILVLTEILLMKKGRRSVGTEYQEPQKSYKRGRQMPEANCQCMAAWCWVADGKAWPVAAQLYLSLPWTLAETKRVQRAGIPEEFRKYRSRSQVALNLLDEIIPRAPATRILAIDPVFGDCWDLLAELDKRREHYLLPLHWQDSWPLPSVALQLGAPGRTWTAEQLYWHWRARHRLIMAMSDLANPRRSEAMRKINAIKGTAWDSVLGFDRFVILHGGLATFPDLYLINHPDIPRKKLISAINAISSARTLHLHLLEKGGLRKFEGRTWRGFNHHVTLCFMAHYYFSSRQAYR